MTVRRWVGERLLEWSGYASLSARRLSGRALVLSYHNIAPDDARPAGDRSLHLARSAFARQLDWLVRHVDVVPLEAILDPASGSAKPRVAITFDDAYRGALTLGAAELRRYGLPATMFVPPGLLGADSFWWDAYAVERGLPPDLREAALDELHGDDALVRAWCAKHGRPASAVPEWMQSGMVAEVRAWANQTALTVGPHTWSHVNLTRVEPPVLERELSASLAWLRERVPAAVLPCLSYPYGIANAATARAAKETGHTSALLVTGGWLPQDFSDRYAVPRLNIPAGLSMRGFRLRLAGLMGAAAASVQQPLLAD